MDKSRIIKSREISGQGVIAEADGHEIMLGNRRLLAASGIEAPEENESAVFVAVDGFYAGRIVISDAIKPESVQAVEELKASGIEKTVMLTGDSDAAGRKIAEEVGIDSVYTQLMPEDKMKILEDVLSATEKGSVIYAGDGINDAPSLTLADVGIAMGAMGTDAAIEAADVVIMDDSPLKISKAIRISEKCMRIVRQNIWGSIGVKLLCLLLGALGLAGMWTAIFADVGISLFSGG